MLPAICTEMVRGQTQSEDGEYTSLNGRARRASTRTEGVGGRLEVFRGSHSDVGRSNL